VSIFGTRRRKNGEGEKNILVQKGLCVKAWGKERGREVMMI
jgi:hypothetical protein